MSIIDLLVGLLIFGVIFWIINIVPQIPGFVKNVLTVIFGIILIIWVLQSLGLTGSLHTPILR